jgi:RimJ/RimL family protein N-acetyltransferase
MLRPAAIEDAKFLFLLRTDPLTQAMFANSNKFSYESHLAWLKGKIESSNPVLIVIFNGQRAGQVRIDSDNSVSISIHADFRGLGLARKALDLALTKHFEASDTISLNYKAEIKTDNRASISTFESVGFSYETTFKRDGQEYNSYTLSKTTA